MLYGLAHSLPSRIKKEDTMTQLCIRKKKSI